MKNALACLVFASIAAMAAEPPPDTFEEMVPMPDGVKLTPTSCSTAAAAA